MPQFSPLSLSRFPPIFVSLSFLKRQHFNNHGISTFTIGKKIFAFADQVNRGRSSTVHFHFSFPSENIEQQIIISKSLTSLSQQHLSRSAFEKGPASIETSDSQHSGNAIRDPTVMNSLKWPRWEMIKMNMIPPKQQDDSRACEHDYEHMCECPTVVARGNYRSNSRGRGTGRINVGITS